MIFILIHPENQTDDLKELVSHTEICIRTLPSLDDEYFDNKSTPISTVSQVILTFQ